MLARNGGVKHANECVSKTTRVPFWGGEGRLPMAEAVTMVEP